MTDNANNALMLAAMKNAVQGLGNICSTLSKVFPNATGTTTTATGGAATLPANPVGFMEVVNPTTGAIVKVPFYS